MNKKQVVTQFKDVLNKEGLKYTSQRSAIFDLLIDKEGHFDCEEIYNKLKRKNISVSLATVYRTLDVLYINSFIRKLDIGDGTFRYERKINKSHHDHLICTVCGNIHEFMSQVIEDEQALICKSLKFKLEKHTHLLYGICKECS